jgi:hypothetical protein
MVAQPLTPSEVLASLKRCVDQLVELGLDRETAESVVAKRLGIAVEKVAALSR